MMNNIHQKWMELQKAVRIIKFDYSSLLVIMSWRPGVKKLTFAQRRSVEFRHRGLKHIAVSLYTKVTVNWNCILIV